MADLIGIQAAAGTSLNGGSSSSGAATTDQALTKINRDLGDKATQKRAQDLKLPYIDVAGFPINPDILHVIPLDEAKTALLMPFFKSGNTLKIAIFDPEKIETKALLAKLTAGGFFLQIHLASEGSILEATKLYASDQYKLKTEIKNLVKDEEIQYEKELANLAHLKDQLATLPAEEGLNLIHVSAIKAGTSDIHYQPEESSAQLRFRIDGVLHKAFDFGKEVYDRLANQLKYKAGMKLNTTNVPQDGRFRFLINERKIDVRVSSIPTEYGESFVCRILDAGKHFASLEELGFSGRSLALLQEAQNLAQGMILTTGPTSSGKTTTLYVLLNAFNKPEYKIITLEDPVEYHLSGIIQSQINEKRGYTFAGGLRSILRQDPDVVMIGEIRDLETAEVSTQAALTGHVLLSTLHTNGAVDTIPRLITIGVPSFLIAPALSIVVAQRLVRRLCSSCMQEREMTVDEKNFLEKHLGEIQKISNPDPAKPAHAPISLPSKIKTPKGCDQCSTTGYRGQMAVSEVLKVDDEMEQAVLANKSAPELFALARKQGMTTMLEDAVLKVVAGQTTIEEVHRVINT